MLACTSYFKIWTKNLPSNKIKNKRLNKKFLRLVKYKDFCKNSSLVLKLAVLAFLHVSTNFQSAAYFLSISVHASSYSFVGITEMDLEKAPAKSKLLWARNLSVSTETWTWSGRVFGETLTENELTSYLF